MRRPSLRPAEARRATLLILTLWLGWLLPGEEAKPYIVGICRLRDGGLPLSAKPFLSSLPQLLALKARPFPPRLSALDYRREVSARLAAAETFKLGAELAIKLDAMAALAFEPQLSPAKRRESLDAATTAVEKAAAALAASRQRPPPKLDPGPLQEARLWEDASGGFLIEQGESDPPTLARSKGIDLLLHGQAEALGDYVALSVSGYEAALDREVFSWRVFADPADPAPIAVELAERLAAWVAGRPFARLDIAVDPPSALVLVDGQPFDASAASLYRFDASRIILGAWAPGRGSEARALDLAPNERRSISIGLTARSYGLATISTEPPDAELFAEGRALGTSPLGVELLGARTAIVAESPGHESAFAVLPSEGRAELNLALRPEDGFGPAGRVEKARDRFYKSLGWLVLALPVASLSLDAFRGYNEAYLRSEDAGLLASRNASGLSFAASAALGAGLAVSTIIRLGDYVGAAR